VIYLRDLLWFAANKLSRQEDTIQDKVLPCSQAERPTLYIYWDYESTRSRRWSLESGLKDSHDLCRKAQAHLELWKRMRCISLVPKLRDRDYGQTLCVSATNSMRSATPYSDIPALKTLLSVRLPRAV